MVWVLLRKHYTQQKICNERDQSTVKSTLFIFYKLYIHNHFDCIWAIIFSEVLCTTYLSPREDREHYKESDKVKAVSFRKRDRRADDKRVWRRHFRPVLYQRATISQTRVAQFLIQLSLFLEILWIYIYGIENIWERNSDRLLSWLF